MNQFPIHQNSFRLHSRSACAFSGVVFCAILWTAAVGFAQDSPADDRALSQLFGDGLSQDPLEVYRISHHLPRITGNPEIPSPIDLISSLDLPGWLPYYDESAGKLETDLRLVCSGADDSHVLIGQFCPELRGASQERLLRYHRPMLEDGTIEYEFFYKSGESAVYPALDRCSFHTGGVGRETIVRFKSMKIHAQEINQ